MEFHGGSTLRSLWIVILFRAVCRKGRHIPGIDIFPSQDELWPFLGWKRSIVVDLPPSDWMISLRDGCHMLDIW